MIKFEFTDKIPDEAMSRQTAYATFVIPDTVTHIGKSAFFATRFLQKVYIPKSVVTIEKDAFKSCDWLEIYCEDEPKEGWVHEMRKEIVHYDITTPEDDAFNFHRSAGSFTFTRVEREIEVFHDWNPSNCPVHTHVDRSVTKDWQGRMRTLTILFLSETPSGSMAEKAIQELLAEHREFEKVRLEWLNVRYEHELVKQYDYESLPVVFFWGQKLYEASPQDSYSDIKSALHEAFCKALVLDTHF